MMNEKCSLVWKFKNKIQKHGLLFRDLRACEKIHIVKFSLEKTEKQNKKKQKTVASLLVREVTESLTSSKIWNPTVGMDSD